MAKEREVFEAEESRKESELNLQYTEEYASARDMIEASLASDEDVVVRLVEDWLGNLLIPVEIDAQFEYHQGVIYIDLDLPEIEDLPTITTKTLKSGQVKKINKTQKQLKEEYATCVTGIAFFMASNVLNLNVNINSICISGYTQRRNSKGDISDDYIYSIKVPRDELAETLISNPVDDFNKFENRMKLSASYYFGKIVPYSMD